ncbi:MAG: oxidoreductase [Ferrovum sp. 37-45-19]|uniref:NADPH dehydrogenase n=2 Tax=Ferrovum sp. JA12 TaxID=1356299 RepID=A0ACD6B9Y1_9PROT|nr:NADH:flavin oxidoreductase/NADH oxidase [Ferrovum sp. JA12]OYV79774.1 MAG: oxidoreductase [Ferrovum sp. 21-44-67]OYV95396.1 MAG: oxidoreductase [Ferrovum sp. 37-45-19]HQT81187.1 NADH:flavin oxidoreductase/NADH oxidase [Ferrovaceae bacterium]KRH78075.1 NADPH dehydrogenase [Ferrovum sp. JA12]HQU05639.1 NADH:flavin oxidoreductase/NADH oxidase [Ferrovaceae bacterium]
MSLLFSPYQLGSLSLANRLVIAPMCQYSAVDGIAQDWHLMHLGRLAISGAGLVIVEATGVNPEGRITPFCLGLYNDEQEAALGRIVAFAREFGQAKMAIQLAHAGRKASTRRPWDPGSPYSPEEGGWQTWAPSAIKFYEESLTPHPMSIEDLETVKQDFVNSAIRAERAGFKAIELHGAHGYLIHQFLSPLSNQRQDQYGGSLENRMRYPLEILSAVKHALSAEMVVGMRISAVDWAPGGLTIEESITFSQECEKRGAGFIHVSTGGLVAHQQIPVGPGYQVEHAQAIKQNVNIPTMAVGLITHSAQAETILKSEQADMIAIARAALKNPHWPWTAALELGDKPFAPPQYQRAR